jgi:hypothetical protein
MSVLSTSASCALLLLLVGCAAPAGTGTGTSSVILSQADLLEANVTTLYDGIERLRRRWLRSRGENFAGRSRVPTVFVDGSARGDLDVLRGIPVTDVVDVRFLSASDAATRFGTTAGTGGAILVRTR